MERVVFFGSGPVAARSLEILNKNFELEAVITKPKPPHHRGSFPVLEVCKKLGLKAYTVSNKAELSRLIADKAFQSRVGVLVDFGIIVSQDVIDFFPKGIVNSHFSLLPEWRGADPITFSILSGQKRTGVSLMLLVEKMDEGPLLAQIPYELKPDETTESLTDELIILSSQALASILPMWLNNEIDPAPQKDVTIAESKTPSYSRKLTKEDGRLDWGKPAEQLEREVRAYIEWPKSYTTIASKEVIITKVHAVPSSAANAKPGDINMIKEAGLIEITTANGSLWIDRLKPAGKKEMSAKEFLIGYI